MVADTDLAQGLCLAAGDLSVVSTLYPRLGPGGKRVQQFGGRQRFGVLLASSSLAALLIGGGASPAFAACVTQNGGTSLALSNSSAINCIEVFNAAVISDDVTNT